MIAFDDECIAGGCILPVRIESERTYSPDFHPKKSREREDTKRLSEQCLCSEWWAKDRDRMATIISTKWSAWHTAHQTSYMHSESRVNYTFHSNQHFHMIILMILMA